MYKSYTLNRTTYGTPRLESCEAGLNTIRNAIQRRGLQVTQELENQYEHRLAVELDRYDRLSEEVETVQQRCEGLLEAQQQEHQWELRAREQVLEAVPFQKLAVEITVLVRYEKYELRDQKAGSLSYSS